MALFWCEGAVENQRAAKKHCLSWRNDEEHVVRQKGSNVLTRQTNTPTTADKTNFTGGDRHWKHQNRLKQNFLAASLFTKPYCYFCVSAANGYISARASPGLLSVSNGNSLGKVVPAKSPPPPSPQMVNSRKPDLRVITSQSGKSLMQLVRRKRLSLKALNLSY